MHWVTTVLAVDHVEHSKTPFYVIGSALVVWAIVLSGLGLSQPAFPRGAVAGRLVMGLSAALVTGTLATIVLVS